MARIRFLNPKSVNAMTPSSPDVFQIPLEYLTLEAILKAADTDTIEYRCPQDIGARLLCHFTKGASTRIAF